MSFGLNPGAITDGPGADSYRSLIPIRYAIPVGGVLFPGQAFKRNINLVAGRDDLYPQYSAGDQAALPTNASAGFSAGVYQGPYQSNPNSVAQNTGIALVRQGVVPVRAAVLNGGTAATIGSILGFSAATGASTYDVPSVQSSYVIGAALGYIVGQRIRTALAAAVSTGSQTVMVNETHGISTSTALTIDYGMSVQETVTPSAVTVQVKASGSIVIGGTAAAGTTLTATVNGVSATYVTTSADTTTALAATHFAAAINQSQIVYGANGVAPVVGPAVVSSSTIYFTALAAGPNGNGITLVASAAGATVTATASGSTFASGAYGTITATFLNPHAAGATVIGLNQTAGASIIPVPSGTGLIDIGMLLVDLAIVGA